jgi:hypothetical protein
MSEWKKQKGSIAERLADAAAQLRAAIPVLVEQQTKAVKNMAKLVSIAQRKS